VTTHARRFDRSRHVRKGVDFEAVKTRGSAFRAPGCLLLALARPSEPTLIGFIASKKGVGGAVERNRARRRLREIVRLRWPRIPETGYALVLIATRHTLRSEHQDLAGQVERVLAAAGALAPIRDADVPAADPDISDRGALRS